MKEYIIFALAFLVACAPAVQQEAMTDNSMMEKEAMTDEMMEDDAMMEKDSMMESEHMEDGTMEDSMSKPQVIAGTTTQYLEWDTQLYEEAVNDGKTVVLQFYANWCPKCKAQEPELVAAYNELDNPTVVGFKVHYKDDETTKEMEDLARKYGIATQGTTVIIKDGEVVKKTPEHLNKEQFISEVNKL